MDDSLQNHTASGTHLLMFDVDGTLVNSMEAEAMCFPRACEQGLGLTNVSSDWETYRHPSDAGIVAELVERHFSRSVVPDDYARVEACFISLLRECYGRRPELCCEIPGAICAFERAQELPNTVVSIATGGWGTTAKFKLATAGFSLPDVPLASSHDGWSKKDIMTISLSRALARAEVSNFASVTYVGDARQDAMASAGLGFNFIGIDTSGVLRDATHRLPDFRDSDRFIKLLVHLRDVV